MDIFSRLLEIGNDVASVWGGYCKSAEMHSEDRRVDFLCVEHGEEFVTSMTFDEIEEEYDVVL